MQTDQTGGSRTRSAGREGTHHVFTSFIKSIFDGRGDGNAEERRGEERATGEVLLACLCVFEFPLPLLLFLLSCFLSHL
jgi:hypothetical protein